ncbi:MAG: HAMP domain-containing protein [Chromatiales bacterium]|nr:HAMP domain-containing protein [Chromatiales bacterium]
MKRPKLLATSALRLALKYALAYAVVLALAVGAFLWSVNGHVEDEDRHWLEREFVDIASSSGEALARVRARLPGADQDGRVYLMVDRDGKRLAGNLLGWPEEDGEVALDSEVHTILIDEELIPRALYGDDAVWPVIARQFTDGSRLLIARRVDQEAELMELAEYLLEVVGVAVLLSLLLGLTIALAILRRMETISGTAGQIMAGDLGKRIPVSDRGDEFDALAERLNAMLDRIEYLVRGIREVSDNVAHDLRSPLTRLRNTLEVTLLGRRSEEEYREALQQGVEDTQGLIDTFNALLSIAQAEAGNRRATWERVDLCIVAHNLADLYEPLAEEKSQTLLRRCEGEISVTASRNLLTQALGNLLENALKYTPEGGTVSLTVAVVHNRAEMVVADTGSGIPAAEREHVLERFVRLESSRHTAGNGLGLSLVRAVCQMHGAELILGDATPGLVVTIRFPLAAALPKNPEP